MRPEQLKAVLQQYKDTRAGQLTPLEIQQICIQRKNLYTDALMANADSTSVEAVQKHFFKAQEMYVKATKPQRQNKKK